MNTVLHIFLIVVVVIFTLIIIGYLTKRRLNLKYSLAWLAACLVMLVLSIFPSLVEKIGKLFGIATITSTVFLFAVMFMLVIILTLTMIVSNLNNRIYRLTQMQAILEKRVRDLEAHNLPNGEDGKTE